MATLSPSSNATTTPRPSSSGVPRGLTVLSLNVWGIFAARAVLPRMKLLRDKLGAYDVICFQEQFDASHAAVLMESGAHPYFHRAVSAPVGSGLAIASKFPIVSTTFVPFRASGKIERLWEGDAVANKGITVTRIAIPKSRLLNSRASDSPAVGGDVEVLFFNTHLVAQYEKYSKIGGYESERNAGHRLAQAHQLAQLVVASVAPGTPFVICGDLNAGFQSPELNLIKQYLAVHDLTIAETIENEASYTPENLYNSGVSTYLEVMNMTEDMPVQLDHVMFGTAALSCVAGTGQVVLKEREVVNGETFQYSDHYGVTGTLVLNTADIPTSRRANEAELSVAAVEALKYASAFLSRRESKKRSSIFRIDVVVFLLLAITFAGFVYYPELPGLVMAVVAFVVGFGVALALATAHLHRSYEAITMRNAVEDLNCVLRLPTTATIAPGGVAPTRK